MLNGTCGIARCANHPPPARQAHRDERLPGFPLSWARRNARRLNAAIVASGAAAALVFAAQFTRGWL